jgi:hypothetical protein
MISFHDRRTGKLIPIASTYSWYAPDEALGHLRANDAPLLGKHTTVNQYSRDTDYQAASDAINSSADGELTFGSGYKKAPVETSYGFSRDALKKKADQLELDAQAKGK